MAQPIAVAEGVSRVYHVGREDVFAVREADWQIPPGRLLALQGRSGSGKTTLLNLVGGLDRPTAGMIKIMDNDTRRMSDRELTMLRRHKIGFIFQAFALLPVLSAYENVELPMRIAGMSARKRHERALDLLDLVGLTKRASHRPFELSGGEQGRVAIARALANQPALLLADEPTGDLDSVTGLQMMLLFSRIVRQEGVTVVMATHDLTVRDIADETFTMSDGVLSRWHPSQEEPDETISSLMRQAEGGQWQPPQEPSPQQPYSGS